MPIPQQGRRLSLTGLPSTIAYPGKELEEKKLELILMSVY